MLIWTNERRDERLLLDVGKMLRRSAPAEDSEERLHRCLKTQTKRERDHGL